MVLHAAVIYAEDDDLNLLRWEISARMQAEPTLFYDVLRGVEVSTLKKRTERGSSSGATFYMKSCT
jgi:hypothetical protein